MVLDDVLSAIDAGTERLVIERLLGRTGLLRRLNSTVILATHAGKHRQISRIEIRHAEKLYLIVRHLHLADIVVVLGSDGHIAEQGTFENLRSQNGFVSKLLLHPELLESSSRADAGDNDAIDSKAKRSTAIPKIVGGATANDVEDLTRRTGDFSVYKYYLKSIDWKIAVTNAACCFVAMLAQSFPRKSYHLWRAKQEYTETRSALWLIWYANGTVSSLPLFAIIYVVAAVLALGAIAMILWFGSSTLP
jgi:ATP-binding cassette subfamily C (CFTR/MRP) protein 1